jgi:hypothetical protein
VRDADEIERGITAFAQSGPGGLVVTSGAHANLHRELIMTLAARHRLPAVYSFRRAPADARAEPRGRALFSPTRHRRVPRVNRRDLREVVVATPGSVAWRIACAT